MNRTQRRVAAKQMPRDLPPAPPLPTFVETLFAVARANHSAGRFQEAEALYREILAVDPRHADSYHLLGVLACQLGRNEFAEGLIGQAIALNPREPAYHGNLGNAFRNGGKLDEAIAAHRRALALEPDFADAHSNLGNALKDQGDLEEAVRSYRRAIAIRPDFFDAHFNLSHALREQGSFDEAVDPARSALALQPGSLQAHVNLGAALAAAGEPDDAVVCLREAVRGHPESAFAHLNLGNLLKDRGDFDEAADAYGKALALDPAYYRAHNNLGLVQAAKGLRAAAIASYRRALALEPGFPEAHNNLGAVLRQEGRFGEAEARHREAMRLEPDYAEAENNLANILKDQGRIDEAIAAFRRVVALKPKFVEAWSNLAFCMNYGDWPIAEEFAAHMSCSEAYRRSAPPRIVHAHPLDTGKRLRIGYVSPDFRRHPVTYFFEPLLMAHDPRAVEVFCYAEVSDPDATTGRLRARADHWRGTVGVSDDDLAERIRADGIDILVDLAGHTAKNRLGAFARKPAPVQVTWLGYPNTTGLAAIDYRLVDPVTDPVGEADAQSSERLFRLDGGFLCYAGAPDAPEPSAPPSSSGAAPTFGSFNNPAKLSPRLLDAWASLLGRLPESRLLLKGRPFADPATRDLFLSRLSERGVSAARVELVGWLPTGAAHLDLYKRIDVALDPFPYNGATTTCEALWMGVPVVTLRGDRHRGRVGASLLSQIGLTDWIAESSDEYQDIAIRLASDPRTLIELRGTVRARMQSSRLCDAKAFAREIEAAYRKMWLNWSEKAYQAPHAEALFPRELS